MPVRPSVFAALLFAFAGCEFSPSAQDASVLSTPDDGGSSDAGLDAGLLLPHPAGCGDRRGPGMRHRDTIASCPLPADADIVTDAGTLPPGEPVLVLGDDVLLIAQGASTASLFDLYRGRQKVQLALAGPYVPKTAIANTIRICLLVTLGGTQLQCFDRNLGTSLFTMPLAFGVFTLEDMQLQSSTLWLSYFVGGGFAELLAIDLVNNQVLWRRPRLDGTGRLVRVGSHLVGYDSVPCPELVNPDACLRAVDALTGQVRATRPARYFHFVWQHGTRALFSDDTEYFEYDAATSTFRDVTIDVAPLVTSLGATRLYPEGEPLPDGRVLINTIGATAPELVVVDPVSLTFKRLGLSSPLHLRIHADVLVTDGAVVSLSADPAPAVAPRWWFGIFGLQTGTTSYARKVQ